MCVRPEHASTSDHATGLHDADDTVSTMHCQGILNHDPSPVTPSQWRALDSASGLS